jgi:glycosyltransferase involved in cell wall biosynthesis
MNRSQGWTGRKILVNLRSWDPTYWKKNVGKLIHLLIQEKAKVFLFCQENEFLNDVASKPGLTVVSYRPSESRFVAFAKALLRYRFDLVLWTYSSYRENILLAAARRLGFLKFVIKSDSLIVTPRPGFRSRIGWAMFKWVARSANLVIVESEEMREWTARFVDPQRLLLLPNGVPLSEFQAIQMRFDAEAAPVKRPFFLYCGRITPEKGLDLLIESFAEVAAQLLDWDLHVVGPVRDQAFHERCVALIREKELGNRIVLQGVLAGEDLYRQYHQADVLVLPSRAEGLANVLPEAMFFRTPVVAFDVGQAASMVDHSVGRLVPAGQTKLFGQAMKELAQNETERKALAEAAHKKISADFDDRILFERLLKTCENL